MTKQQAYDMLNNALASINTSRQGHMALSQALDFLAAESNKNNAKEATTLKAVPEPSEGQKL